MTAASPRGLLGPLEQTTGAHIFWPSLALLHAANVLGVACGTGLLNWESHPKVASRLSLAVRLAKMLIFRVTRAQRGDCHEYNRLLEDPDPSPPAWWPGRYCDPTSPARCRTPRRPSPVSWNSSIKPPKSGAWRLSSLMAGTSSAQACWPQALATRHRRQGPARYPCPARRCGLRPPPCA